MRFHYIYYIRYDEMHPFLCTLRALNIYIYTHKIDVNGVRIGAKHGQLHGHTSTYGQRTERLRAEASEKKKICSEKKKKN